MRSDVINCSNCGAQGVKNARCPYCGSYLSTDADDYERETVNLTFGSLIGLPDTYVIEVSIGQGLYVVKSTENNCNKFGVYNADSNSFELEPIFTSIMACRNGNYVAIANILMGNNGVLSKSIEFSSVDGFQVIKRSERHYQHKVSSGCLPALIFCIITMSVLIMFLNPKVLLY